MNRTRISNSKAFLVLLGISLLLTLLGAWAALRIESGGHILTGMNNSVPWGVALTLATFLLVAASGTLNLASLSSVFGREAYKPFASFSALLALSLLAGGLFTLMLDLGRPKDVFLVLNHFNAASVFSLNIVIYAVFFLLVGLYWLLTIFTPQGRGTRVFGFAAFVWRIILTTGSGCVFAVLAGRSALHSALLPPLFIALSLSLGLAVSVIALYKAGIASERPFAALCQEDTARGMGNLLAILVAVTFYMAATLHLVGLNSPPVRSFERFVLCSGGIFPVLLWGGFVTLGTLIPLILLLVPALRAWSLRLPAAAGCVVLGSFALMYTLIITPQVYPPEIFPGKIVEDVFYGTPATYEATALEWFVGLGGLGLAGLLSLFGMRVLPVLPNRFQPTSSQ
ncbi:MAG: polysulfide reductase NrfD [Desulfovibrio sp.]|jgi:molybdopterin-containing oxidoreductase family membrane subunit|nr:polysulfide reductase NrfD [Desulfovibrio sp.]